jgi:predicted nucleotidyltransferase
MSKSEVITGTRCATDEEILEKANLIIRKFDPEKIILFGSYAAGNPLSDSDVDLFIIMNSEKPSWEKSVEISLALKHTFPIDIIVETPEEIDKRLNAGIFSSITFVKKEKFYMNDIVFEVVKKAEADFIRALREYRAH